MQLRLMWRRPELCRCHRAGSNYLVRASALAQVGWFPTYTAAEGHALGMVLKAAGHRGTYLAENLAAGQGPRPGKELLRQRARWARGHMQVGCTAGSSQPPLASLYASMVHAGLML
jgi:cellulose synthase/poly-beta-1,6-N-acetylglucosamine synthase-like glycosyltransferase